MHVCVQKYIEGSSPGTIALEVEKKEGEVLQSHY